MKKRLVIAALVVAALSVAPAVARDCSGTITTGGTAQTAISAPTGMARSNGFMICNLSTSEPLWLNPNGTAAAAMAGSAPLQAATASYAASGGCYQTSPTWTSQNAVSVFAATSAHAFTCWTR